MQNGLGQKQAFENFKHVLTTKTTMAYFDSSKNTELYVDAFPFGLGAILTQTTPCQQDTKVIAYASRSLTYTESQYSQIERESLAIVYGIEHFHIYLYGHEFTLVTDYKPLELIYRNPKSRPSARLERWCLRLQDYTFQVKYQTGPANPSDYLSRHPLTTRPDNKQQNLSDEHVRFVVNHAVPVALDVNNRELKICNAAARRRAFKPKNIFIEDNTMNNLWSQKCCELRSHSQYNLKLSISTSLEQRKNVF